MQFGESETKTVAILNIDDETDEMSIDHVDLGLPKKITVKMDTSELNNYNPPENSHVRLHLIGTVEELQKCRKTKKYKELAQKVKIIPKPTNVAFIKRNVKREGYIDILAKSISAESEAVKEIYEEVIRDASDSN